MKSAGIVRNVDDLGRIVIPMEIRKRLEINPGDPVEIFVDGASIVLEKYVQSCIFCGGKEGISEHCGKLVCAACRRELAK